MKVTKQNLNSIYQEIEKVFEKSDILSLWVVEHDDMKYEGLISKILNFKHWVAIECIFYCYYGIHWSAFITIDDDITINDNSITIVNHYSNGNLTTSFTKI